MGSCGEGIGWQLAEKRKGVSKDGREEKTRLRVLEKKRKILNREQIVEMRRQSLFHMRRCFSAEAILSAISQGLN
jgi:hypothetical protein